MIAELESGEKNDGSIGGEDMFGANDQDWDMYKDIQKDGFIKDEEDDQQELLDIEDQIAEIDPSFNLLLYQAGQAGNRPSTEEDFQIRLWADRYKGSEVLFQPSLIGSDCAGVSESLETIFNQLSRSQIKQMMENVVILGGNSMVAGFDRRIKSELVMLGNYQDQLNILNYNLVDAR